jgi:signal transduction histidine kinase
MVDSSPREPTGDPRLADLLFSDYRRTEELGTLREVARALAAGSSANDVMRTICNAATQQGRGSGSSVAVVSGDFGTFVANTGLGADLIGLRFPLTGSITGRVATELRSIAITSARESSPFFAELLPRLGIGPILVLPLLAHDNLVGVLSVFRREGEAAFDSGDESRLAAMADLAALALWNARALEAVQRADASKTSFLATLSHELRTPIAALEGYGELLEDEILGPLTPEQRETLTRMRTVGRHLGSLIEDILTYASLEADRLTVREAEVAVKELVDSILPYIEPLARARGLELQVFVADDADTLVTDEDRVRQVLLNLLSNAIKFTPTGDVTLRVYHGSTTPEGGGTLRFAVRDTGIGIDGAELPRLFRPFSQLADVTSRREQGTGLGLYISRRLATILGGRIEVVSRPGEGSTFTLVLPRVRGRTTATVR